MSSKVAKLVSAYRQHLTVPWQAGLAAIQRVIFAVYDKADELRLRANVEEFALATQQAGKQWLLLDVTNAFPEWMASQEYRDAYFESPEDLAGYEHWHRMLFARFLAENGLLLWEPGASVSLDDCRDMVDNHPDMAMGAKSHWELAGISTFISGLSVTSEAPNREPRNKVFGIPTVASRQVGR